MKDTCKAKLFCFALNLSLGLFDIHKSILKLHMAISWSIVGNKYNLGISRVAQTHILTNADGRETPFYNDEPS